MANYIGEYVCKLDAKGRFLFPAGLKKQLDPSAEEKFVVNRGFEGCLVLFPMNEWKVETSKLSKLNLFKAKDRKFYRDFHNGATQVELDGQGRILMPKNLKSSAEIKKDIVLFAYANRIEIWAKDKYGEVTDIDADEFGKLAEDVMGDTGNDDKQ
ncbi:MAG: division/cell wall cluster transcriptional repressor MraZ [Flavobacteriales bacterium]|nr:division/cell wall cluster transcriptional repressor MraZ [Bacteroidales bacterium AH-315-I05]PCJ89036.1 MAG: division/cell wall cluster transcriptional repressor MraZ [Flavobacteriales bacterium]